jgi:hypothetical protein
MLAGGRLLSRLSTTFFYSASLKSGVTNFNLAHFSTPTTPRKMPTRGLKPAELLARNTEWCEDKSVTDAELLKQNALGQNPSILWIGCSDSRVPESVVAKCNPGDIFTHRNIAGQFSETDDSAMSVLTYAVEALGVEHSECFMDWIWRHSATDPLSFPSSRPSSHHCGTHLVRRDLGITGYCKGRLVPPTKSRARPILEALGRAVWLDPKATRNRGRPRPIRRASRHSSQKSY